MFFLSNKILHENEQNSKTKLSLFFFIHILYNTMSNVKYACYTQISPQRDITKDAFSTGQMIFNINNDSMSRWCPAKSYFRLRIKMTKPNPPDEDIQLNVQNNISPALYQPHCLFQQMNVSCAGTKISEIDDYVPQIAALRNRYAISEGRRKEFLSYTEFADASFDRRLNMISKNGFDPADIVLHDFLSLKNGNVFILDTETIVGAGNILHYRNNGGGGDGAINLQATKMRVGDSIYLMRDTNEQFSSVITQINAKNIVMEDQLTANFAATLIVPHTFSYTRAKPSLRNGTYELIFRPCLGFWKIPEFIGGNYKIELTPVNSINFKKYAIESLNIEIARGEAANPTYDVEIVDMQLYLYKGRATSVANGSKSYTFTEIRAQGQTIVSAGVTNKTFVVNPSSHTFSIAFQSEEAGDDTRFPKTKFKVENDQHLKLTRFSLRYNGNVLPNPTPDITYSKHNTLFVTQQYYESLMHNNSLHLHEPESLALWIERGPYYSYKFPQVPNSSNRLYVSQQFSGYDNKKFQILVFDHFYKGFTLEYDNGLVKRCIRFGDTN